MKIRIFLFALLLTSAITAQTNPILLEKPVKSTGQSVNLDGSSEYASVTPSLRLTGNYALRDDFSDGNYTGWTVTSGAYAVNNSVVNPLSTNQYSLVCNTAGVISIPCNQAYGRWSFDLYKGADANFPFVAISHAKNNLSTYNGSYGIALVSNESVAFYKDGGNILASNSSYIANSTWYHIDIERTTAGVFSVWITGGAFTTKTLVSTVGGGGTNPVTDATYSTSNYFVLDLDAGDRFSNLVCQYGEGSLDLNSYERVLHSDNRGFEATTGLTWAANNITATVVPTSYTVNAGTGDSNPVDSVQTQDSKYVTVQELAGGLSGADALNVSFNLTVPTGVKLDTLYFKGFYEGSPTHAVIWQAYNGSTWNNLGDSLVSTSTNTLYKITGFLPTHNRSGSVTVRVIHHTGLGNLTHYLDIDYVAIKYRNNHSVAISNTDKKTGTYSLAVTSTTAGDATTNYISLPSASKVDLVAGEKYTIEGYARGTGVLGSELITNAADRDFSSDTGFWSKGGTGISIADGVCHFTTTSLYAELRRANLVSIGKVYKITYTVKNYVAGQVFANVGANGATRTANGTYTDYILASGTTLVFGCGAVSTTLDIDDVTVKEITYPSITLSVGGQSKTISSISCVPGTFTKLVWNFQATFNEVNQPIKIYANQADVIYLDDFSVTQAWDMLVSVWIKTTHTANKIAINFASGSGPLFYTIIQASNIAGEFKSITGNVTNLSANLNLNTNTYLLLQGTVNRAGSHTYYLNGVPTSPQDISGVGKMNFSFLYVGDYYTGGFKFNGNIGETQITKFRDITQSNVNTSTLTQAYKGGLGTWTNGIPVAWYKFRGATDSQMLRDYSNSANNLSGTNVTTADQERGAYPSK